MTETTINNIKKEFGLLGYDLLKQSGETYLNLNMCEIKTIIQNQFKKGFNK
jgi:hypothetical protein